MSGEEIFVRKRTAARKLVRKQANISAESAQARKNFLFLLPKKQTGLIEDTRPLSVTNTDNRVISSVVAHAIMSSESSSSSESDEKEEEEEEAAAEEEEEEEGEPVQDLLRLLLLCDLNLLSRTRLPQVSALQVA